MTSMFNRLKLTTCLVTTLALTALVVNSGCGELVSGAHIKPAVKYRRSGTETAATETAQTAAQESTSSEGTGTLKGKVVVNGDIPAAPPLYAKGADVKDAAVCAAESAPNQTVLVKDGGLANVFIYLKKAPKNVPPADKEAKVIFDQKYCVFKPHAMAIRIGQTVRVLNSDSVAHNTHTNPKKNNALNSIVSPNDQEGIPLIYKQAEQEPISVVCDVHSWMRAYHLPIDHPYVAVSGEDGTFEIKDLPAGKHEFKVWHEAGGLLDKGLVVNIKAGDNEQNITVSAGQLGK